MGHVSSMAFKFYIHMKINIHHLFQEFLNECTYIRRLRPQTLRGYNQTFTTLHKLIPTISLDTLTPLTITTFFKVLHVRKRIVGSGKMKEGIKDSTIATYWTKLNTFCIWLEIRKYISSNPCTSMRYRAPLYEDIQFLSKGHVEKIITALYLYHVGGSSLSHKRNLVLFYLLLFCGLRRGEVLGLQVRDIDLERGIVIVRGNTSKSGRSRHIPLHSTLLFHLREYLKERVKYTTPYLLVSSRCDAALTLDGLKHVVDELRVKSKIQFHLHQFRHTFAVNFLKTSNNIAKLKQLLGHQDIRMTLLYLRCLPVDTMREDIEQMSIENLL